jgi:hypothetical protein
MNISRPAFVIVPSPSGKVFTWRMTADTWTTEYQSLQTFDSEKAALDASKSFAKTWDSAATKIEQGGKRVNMLDMLTQNGVLKSRPKLDDSFSKFKA